MFKGKVSKVLVFGLACMAVVAMLALSACGGGVLAVELVELQLGG